MVLVLLLIGNLIFTVLDALNPTPRSLTPTHGADQNVHRLKNKCFNRYSTQSFIEVKIINENDSVQISPRIRGW